MSINVETIGSSTMVQHYVETLGHQDQLILNSDSDVFTPTGRTKIHVTWELSVGDIRGGKSEFTNRARCCATDEFLTFSSAGCSLRAIPRPAPAASIAQNQGETPLFAAGIERAALRN